MKQLLFQLNFKKIRNDYLDQVLVNQDARKAFRKWYQFLLDEQKKDKLKSVFMINQSKNIQDKIKIGNNNL